MKHTPLLLMIVFAASLLVCAHTLPMARPSLIQHQRAVSRPEHSPVVRRTRAFVGAGCPLQAKRPLSATDLGAGGMVGLIR